MKQAQSLLKKHRAAVVIQSQFRRMTARRQYLKQREAVALLQRHVRGWQARRLAKKERAAIKIQSFWRMRAAKKAYQQALNAVIQMQSSGKTCC